MEDLNESITQLENLINITPDGDPGKPGYLSNLGNFLDKRFERLGTVADIDKAIISKQASVDLTPGGHLEKPAFLSNLGNSLRTRFIRQGNIADLDNARASHQAAVDLTPDSHPKKPDYLNNLGTTLITRFSRLGNVSDIENSIASIRAAVNLTPKNHPAEPVYLNNLGNALYNRFKWSGSVADIDNAIKSNEASVDLTPDSHPKKAIYLTNLGNCFHYRFERLRRPVDLDNAIKVTQASINLTPNGHPEKPARLSDLGIYLVARFPLRRDIADLDNAAISSQAAVDLTLDNHPNKPIYLNSLGHSFQARFESQENLNDIDNAIVSKRAAVDLTPDNHPEKPNYLQTLGLALLYRFKRLKGQADIDDSITSLQKAVLLAPEDGFLWSWCRRTLGGALFARFLHYRDPHDAETAISHLSASANSQVGYPEVRFDAAKMWSNVAYFTNHPSLLAAYECVINLMPIVAWLGLPIPHRHQHLIEMGGITQTAASVAISLGQYDKALEWIEQGRSIVWTQILQLRTPVDALRDVRPELADRLVEISQLLGQEIGQNSVPNRSNQYIEEKGRQYRALTMEREAIIEQVRSMSQFENFLRPPKASQLIKAAKNGPVIILNIAKQRCDALALVHGSENVIHIPLTGITYERVTELGGDLKDLLASSGIRVRAPRAAKKVESETNEESCKCVLAELWKELVKPVLDSLKFMPDPSTLPRIWWCTTGPLAFLPIHAAGIYGPQSTSDQLVNYAISSYTPTVSTLLEKDRLVVLPFKLLSVIQSSAPGVSVIPNTQKELDCIRNRLCDQVHVVLEGVEGTKERVMKGMNDCNWLHLACHGIQKPEPTKSALVLQDGHLTLEEIIQLDLPNAEFAFLSACQTTKGDEKLSEEAVHIAGGMLLAGYRGVVATMWSIEDELAPEVADEFYAHLTRDGQEPNSRRAAEALHVSVQKLRKKNIPLTSWIPFVHLGV